jgi:hypothetical protein
LSRTAAVLQYFLEIRKIGRLLCSLTDFVSLPP